MGGYQQIAVTWVDPEGVHVDRSTLCDSATVFAATGSQRDDDEDGCQDRRWKRQQKSRLCRR